MSGWALGSSQPENITMWNDALRGVVKHRRRRDQRMSRVVPDVDRRFIRLRGDEVSVVPKQGLVCVNQSESGNATWRVDFGPLNQWAINFAPRTGVSRCTRCSTHSGGMLAAVVVRYRRAARWLTPSQGSTRERRGLVPLSRWGRDTGLEICVAMLWLLTTARAVLDAL